MTARELSEWMAFYQIEPFGDRRGDIRNSSLMCLIANMFGGNKKTFEIEDFMPNFEPPKEPDPQEVAERIKQYFTFLAGARKQAQEKTDGGN